MESTACLSPAWAIMATMKTIPLWTDQYPRPGDLLTSQLPERADVAIIGSGYTGLNAALALAHSGARTAVLEQETIGWGASSRNGSMLTTGLKTPLRRVLQRYGLQAARHFWQWSLDSIDHVEQVIAQEGIGCDFHRPGHACLAYKPQHFQKIKAYAELLSRDFGYTGFELVEPQDLHTEIGSPVYFGAMTENFSAMLHPAKYVFGLAEAARRRGASLVEG